MNKNKMIGILSILIAVISIIVILTYRAQLGGIIFIAASMIADYVLRTSLKEKTGEEYPNYVLAFISEKKAAVPKYVTDAFKGQDFIEKILGAIVMALPFVVAVCVVLWIIWDTNREVDSLFGDY